MFRPQFSLRALVGVLTLAACLLGTAIPAYKEYQRLLFVSKVRHEVEIALAHASSQVVERPEVVQLEVWILQAQIQRAPMLTDSERRAFDPGFERILSDCAREIDIEQLERWKYSCGVPLERSRENIAATPSSTD